MLKKLLLLSIAVGLCVFTMAQEIEPCNGNTQRNMANLEKSAIFNVTGINLNKYDWSEPNINCHINQTINEYTTSRLFKYLGYGGLVTGLPVAITGFGATAKAAGKQGSLIGLGIGLSGAGVYSLFHSNKKQRKSDRHMQNVSNYYRANDLF